MKIKHQHRGILAACIGIALYFLGIFLPKERPLAVLLSNGYILSFSAGIVVYYLWRRFLQHKITSPPVFCGIISILLLVWFYLLPRKIMLQILVSSLVLICTLISTHQKPIPKIFTHFSTISYSFYLTHYYVILILGKFFDFTHLNINTILGIGIVFVSTALISFCSYILVEKKLGNLLNQVFRN